VRGASTDIQTQWVNRFSKGDLVRSTLFALLLTWTFAARADVVNGFELFPLLNGPQTWESSTPLPRDLKDQGKFPYCGIYALATFLEVWGSATHTGQAFPPIDEAFLSYGYNRVIGSPGIGTHPMWLSITTQIFGAIPKGSKYLGKDAAWPRRNWEKENLELLPTSVTDPVLTGKYTYGRSNTQFTGQTFLRDVVRIDLRNFYGLHTNFEEKYRSQVSPDEEESFEVPFRMGDIESTGQNMQLLAQKIGGDTRMAVVPPEVLYKAAKAQLYARRPVYLAINAGLTRDKFRKYGLIVGRHLYPENQGYLGPHAVVAVAHCDKTNSVDRICQRFNRYLELGHVDECIAVQNSWGPDVNHQGYFCLAPDAWRRVVTAILLDKSLVKN
jgi:hypothetical protein